jgi:hypothetical protein
LCRAHKDRVPRALLGWKRVPIEYHPVGSGGATVWEGGLKWTPFVEQPEPVLKVRWTPIVRQPEPLVKV